RSTLIICCWLWYLGLKEEVVTEREEIKFKREKRVILRDMDARISFIESLSKSRPMEISPEEISLYHEQGICIVCKGKLGRFNVFTCPKCDVFYCKKCVEALTNLENACWVCNAPLDESKPTKPYKKVEIAVEGIEDLPDKPSEEMMKPHKNKHKKYVK
ncbi:unnamed protein product, partial [marine sediment metagenome]